MVLLFVFSGLLVQTQQPANLKGEVYSAFLEGEFASEDSLNYRTPRRKYQSVVVIPATKKEWSESLVELMTPPQLPVTVRVPNSTSDAKPVWAWGLGPLRSEFKDWLQADTSLARMGRQFDALEQNAQAVAGPIIVPGHAVTLEGPNFFGSDKWRNWKYFYRKNKNSYGVVSLSDIIFSTEGKCAVFYAGIHRASLGGSGYYVFMEKTVRGWQMKYTCLLWMS
ncbi:hypothetical protein [Hymenobacter terrenus]|uniref:hypothetical protein n=1 Tax=Hymenobacter terrenus TaxID=1629124 RepID=UPI0012DFFDAC|nr:hypothetical protein [Hymenobacter terrenus]